MKTMVKGKGVFYLYRNGFDYYSTEKTQVLHQAYPDTVVQDLEVLNKEEFQKFLSTFIATNKLVASRVLIVLSEDILFRKEIIIDPAKPLDVTQETNQFITNIPFEHVGSKKIQHEKKTIVVATNRDLYVCIQSGLEKNGWSTAAVIASAVFEKDIKLAQQMTVDQGKFFVSKIEAVKPADNFLDQPNPVMIKRDSSSVGTGKAQQKSSLPLLIGVFAVLLPILGGVYYWQTYLVPQPKKRVIKKPSPTLIPTVIPSLPVSTASATIQPEKVTVQILNASGVSGQAERTRQDLKNLGFTQTQIGTASVTVSRTLLVVAETVPQGTRTVLIDELQKTYGIVSVQETKESQYDIIITLSKPLPVSPSVTP